MTEDSKDSDFCESPHCAMNSSYFLTNSSLFSSKMESHHQSGNLISYGSLLLTTTLTSITTFSLLTVTAMLYSKRTNNKALRIVKSFVESKQFQIFLSKLKLIVVDVFLFFFTATWLMMASFPYGCLLFLRWAIVIYMKIAYGPLSSLVAGLDAIGTVDSPKSRQIIKSLKVLKGECDLEDLRKRCEGTVGRKDQSTGEYIYPKFYQYLDTCFGYYCWKPSNFDINHHVRFYDHCDIDLDKSTSESEAMKLISMNANEPFDQGRANWEILVIPKFHYDKEEEIEEEKRVQKFAFIIRISHGIGDGFSLMKLIMRDMAGETGSCIPVSKSKETSWVYKIAVFLYVFCTSPRTFYTEMGLKDKNSLHNENVLLDGRKEILWSDPINIDWLKSLKNSLGSGMSTVLLGALSGACRKYILQQYNCSEEELPEHISALIPMPAPNHPDNKMCNKFSAIMFPLEFKSSDPVERCKAIDVQGRIVASSPDAPVNLFLMNLIGVAPIMLSKYFITNTQTTVVVSNVPGPGHSIKIWGKELLDTMFWLPTVGESGISLSFLSYKSHLRVGITVDTGVIPDGAQGARNLLEWMLDDLKSMAKAVKSPEQTVLIDIVKAAEDIKPISADDKEDSSRESESEDEIIEELGDINNNVIPLEDAPSTAETIFEKSTFSFEDSVLKSRHGLLVTTAQE